MAVAQCLDPKSLQRFLLGQLPAASAATVESHVLACPRCAKVLPTLAADDTLVEAMRARANSGLPQHEKDLLDGLMMRLQKQRPRPGSENTATGENTMSHSPADDDSRALVAFLAPAQAADELGRLGHYRVLKVLGHGGMGVVFQAEDAHLKRSVAVKAMLPEVAKKSTARERFLREARAAAGLEHDHVVTVHHVGEERGVPFMVMPMLKGSSLEDFIKKKPNLTTGQILKVGREIARGLAAAHEVGLIHRDIKPGNIWLDATAGGRVKILDFGLARSGTDDHITQAGLIVGTAAYMAPEQARGEEVDGRADLFSLGVILYRLCTGQTPWKGSDAVSTLLLAATEPAAPVSQLNPNVPPPLADLIMQLLAKKPEERPISARSVADDLGKIERSLKAATVPVATAVQPAADVAAFQSMTTDGPTVALPKKRQRGRRWPWAAATFLAAACAAAFFIIIRITNKDGTVTEVKVPTGAKVEIEKDGKVIAQAPVGDAAFAKWVDATKKLPAEEQVKAVAAKLKELNPGFDGQMTHNMKQGQVHRLKFLTDQVVDVTPIRALPGLDELNIGASRGSAGRLPGLAALRGLRLKELKFENNPLCSDLEPLRGMPLVSLNCGDCRVRDLEPLRSMPLQILSIVDNPIADLAPVRGMALQTLWMYNTQIADLTPLAGMPLEYLNFGSAPVTDLAALRGMPSHSLTGLKQPERHVEPLKSLWALNRLNGKPAADFWQQHDPKHAALLQWIENAKKLPPEKQVEAVTAKLKELNPGFDGNVTHRVFDNGAVRFLKFSTDQVADLTPVRALPFLVSLDVSASAAGVGRLPNLEAVRGLPLQKLMFERNLKCGNLEPLRGMPLVQLYCGGCQVRDLGPLQGMPLQVLFTGGNPLTDLTPLKGMPLQQLYMPGTQVTDLTPLVGAPLESLTLGFGSPVTDLAPLRGMPLRFLHEFKQPERHAAALKALWALEQVNGKPATNFWQQHDPKHAAFLQWIEATKKLPAEEQVKAVTAKLQELNPGFNSTVTHKITNGVVIHLGTVTNQIVDLSPVRALAGLKEFNCLATAGGKSKLNDVGPLAGLPLVHVKLTNNQAITDLSPLRSIPTLETINDVPAAEFWKQREPKP